MGGGGGCPVRAGLTSAYFQGAYGVVRLAYNESEDRHYVSLGVGGRCCPGQAPEAWEVGRGCAGKTEDKAASRGSELLSLRVCLVKRGSFLTLRICQQRLGPSKAYWGNRVRPRLRYGHSLTQLNHTPRPYLQFWRQSPVFLCGPLSTYNQPVLASGGYTRVTFLPLPPQAMKVLSKKKLLKQYGFPRMYLLGPTLGSSLLLAWGQRRRGPRSVASFFRTGVEVGTA